MATKKKKKAPATGRTRSRAGTTKKAAASKPRTVGARMKQIGQEAKKSPEKAHRKSRTALRKAMGSKSLTTRARKSARRAADAVVGAGASAFDTVRP